MKKSNFFVRRARYHLPVASQLLIQELISKVAPGDGDFKRYQFEISSLYSLLGFKKESYRRRRTGLKRAINFLQKNLIEIPVRHPKHGGEITLTPAWIEAPAFDWERDIVSLRISDQLKPFILVDKKFTCWRKVRFKRAYSFRFYEWCRDFWARPDYHDFIRKDRYVKKEYFALNDLRDSLGLANSDKMRVITNFKNYVLTPSRVEIAAKTDCYFEFEPVKRGRNVIGYNFLFYGSVASDQWQSEAEEDNQKGFINGSLNKRMTALGVSQSFQNLALRKYDTNDIRVSLEAVEEFQQTLRRKGKRLNYPDLAFEKSLLDAWVSKRETIRRREWEKAEERKDSLAEAAALVEGIKNRERQKEIELETVNNRSLREYEKRNKLEGDQYRNLRNQREKVDYIMSLIDYPSDLNLKQWEELKDIIDNKVADNLEFEIVKGTVIEKIISFSIPDKIRGLEDELN